MFNDMHTDMHAVPSGTEIATEYCVVCAVEFSDDNPCCCDEGTWVNGLHTAHVDGTCRECCKPNHQKRRVFDGKFVAGGIFLRGE